MTHDDDLRTTAGELYAGPLADFVSVRTARAKEAGGALAASIKALRKPSIAAWVVNVFARERPDELAEALQLAQELRDAQADLDAASLAALGRERRLLTRRLAEHAAQLATARGEKVTSGTMDAVQQTIGAAFFDENAATAVASGRLVRELEPSGGVDLDDVVGGGAVPGGEAPGGEARGGEAPTDAPTDELAARRERRRRERAVRTAEEAVTAADRSRRAAESEEREAAERIPGLDAEIVAEERRLVHLRRERERASEALSAATARRDAACATMTDAERALDEARTHLDRIDDRM